MKFYYLFPFLAFSLTILNNSIAELVESKKELIKIGIVAPLTGGLAARGDDITKLLPFIKSHLDSLETKYTYEFILEDGKCGAGNATTTAVKKLINIDKVQFLITACSGETLQAGPIVEKQQILTIAVLSLHPDIRNLGDYIFRTFIDIEASVRGFTEYLKSKHKGKIAILTEENSFTFEMKDLLLENLEDQVVYSEDLTPESADFNTFFAKINAREVEVIYLNVMSDVTLANLVNQARRMNLKQKIFSYTMPESVSFRKATGKNSDNLYFIGTPDIQSDSKAFQEILQDYYKQHLSGPSYEFIVRTTFDAVKSIVDGVEAVGPDATKVKDFLYQYSTMGALGKVEYDQNGDIKGLHYVLRKITEDGENQFVTTLVND